MERQQGESRIAGGRRDGRSEVVVVLLYLEAKGNFCMAKASPKPYKRKKPKHQRKNPR
jgi:hypothetical protein